MGEIFSFIAYWRADNEIQEFSLYQLINVFFCVVSILYYIPITYIILLRTL